MKKLIASLFALFCVIDVHAQGLNNDYPYDSVDVKNAFSMLGVETFKFPFVKKAKLCYLKVYMEIWENDSLIKRVNETAGLDSLTKSTCLRMDKSDMVLRLYDRQVNDSTVMLSFNVGALTITEEIAYPGEKYGLHNSRAYDLFQPEPGKEKPVYVRTFVDKKQTSMHCPGGRPKEMIAQYWPYAIFVIVDVEEADMPKTENR